LESKEQNLVDSRGQMHYIAFKHYCYFNKLSSISSLSSFGGSFNWDKRRVKEENG